MKLIKHLKNQSFPFYVSICTSLVSLLGFAMTFNNSFLTLSWMYLTLIGAFNSFIWITLSVLHYKPSSGDNL